MKKIITTLLTLLFLSNINSFAQKDDPIKMKLLDAAGDKTFLKDFPFQLDPGEEKQFPVQLQKKTWYYWYAFLSEYKQFRITIYDEYYNTTFQNKENAIDVINFSTKSNKPVKYILNIKNTSTKPITSTILLMYAGKFNPKKDIVSNPILDKLGAASNSTYLKDFSMNLEPGGEARYSLVLSKNSIYELSTYQYEPNQFEIKLFDNKSKEPQVPTSMEVNNKITSLEYTINETGIYHLFVKNNSSKQSKTVILLTFVDRIEDIIPISKQTVNQDQPKLEYAEKDKSYYFVVDKMPKFKGKKDNNKEFREFINQEIKYPQEAIDKKIEGKVFVQFVIGKNGYIKDAKVARGIHPSIDQEALRVVYSSPKWEPGIKDGEPVDVMFTFPIEFKLP